MARTLADHEIRKLLGTVILNGDENLLNPNGIELRLGEQVRFLSTLEKKEIPQGGFIQVQPGETAMIVSMEKIDFSRATVEKHYVRCAIQGWLTPTTTMVREGQMHAATKIDAGFTGQLNWGFRNSSYNDFTLGRGESIVKLTLELLEGDEVPEQEYGQRPNDRYQNTTGILISGRKVPVDIPKDRLVRSAFDKLDPKKRLRDAGYPFNAIGSDLVQLHEKFEIVSGEVKALTEKIDSETKSIMGKLDETKTWAAEHFEHLFTKKFVAIVAAIAGLIPMLYAILVFLQGKGVQQSSLAVIALFVGVALWIVTALLIWWRPSRRRFNDE
jgi:deoxycytidine triphosphate deaminase